MGISQPWITSRESRKHGCVNFLVLINGLVRRVSDRVTEGRVGGMGSVLSSDSTGYALFEKLFFIVLFPFALLKPSFEFFFSLCSFLCFFIISWCLFFVLRSVVFFFFFFFFGFSVC